MFGGADITSGTGVGGRLEREGVRERQPASRDSRIPRPAWGPDLTMMDDEYL